MSRTVKMICPVTGCNFMAKTKEAWKEHFKDEHPDQEEINFGGSREKIKEE